MQKEECRMQKQNSNAGCKIRFIILHSAFFLCFSIVTGRKIVSIIALVFTTDE